MCVKTCYRWYNVRWDMLLISVIWRCGEIHYLQVSYVGRYVTIRCHLWCKIGQMQHNRVTEMFKIHGWKCMNSVINTLNHNFQSYAVWHTFMTQMCCVKKSHDDDDNMVFLCLFQYFLKGTRKVYWAPRRIGYLVQTIWTKASHVCRVLPEQTCLRIYCVRIYWHLFWGL